MALDYDAQGIRFKYPENWEVITDGGPGWPRAVSVHSPAGAFWSINQDQRPAEGFLEQIADAIAGEYEDVERSSIQRRVGDRVLEGLELHFFCLDMLVIANLLELPDSALRTVFQFQAESREFEQLGPVFEAISLSFIQSS